MTMTNDTSMIYKNTSKMTNSGSGQKTHPVTMTDEVTTTVFSPVLSQNQNSFLLMETETPFNWEGIQYLSAYHYMMAEVASLMGDNDMAYVIKKTTCISSLNTLNDRMINVNGFNFENEKMDLFFKANYYKFLTCTMQRDKLLHTGSSIILYVHREFSTQELKNGAVYQYKDVIDHNCLGKILMEIRDTIRERMSDASLI
jgi:predicted NAD-dependent protein-ADP-ribosyltransferase YbiA (DUF1768 family)